MEDQRDTEWYARRCGRVTASRLGDAIAKSKPKMSWCTLDLEGNVLESFGGGKTGMTKAAKMAERHELKYEEVEIEPGESLMARSNYTTELVIERLTNVSIGFPDTAATRWGRECEEAMICAYEAKTGIITRKSGFIILETLPCFGASPDRLIDDDGGLEGKCPFNMANHLETILHGMPQEHMPQVQGGMLASKRKWWDFVSFDPRFPKKFRLYIERIYRDEEYIERMRKEIISIDLEVTEKLNLLLEKQ